MVLSIMVLWYYYGIKYCGIMVLKQDKRCGAFIMNRSTYIEKCFFIINSNQFTQLDHDPSDKFNTFSITLQFQIIVPPAY